MVPSGPLDGVRVISRRQAPGGPLVSLTFSAEEASSGKETVTLLVEGMFAFSGTLMVALKLPLESGVTLAEVAAFAPTGQGVFHLHTGVVGHRRC